MDFFETGYLPVANFKTIDVKLVLLKTRKPVIYLFTLSTDTFSFAFIILYAIRGIYGENGLSGKTGKTGLEAIYQILIAR